MATAYSDIQTIVNGPAFGAPAQTRVKVNRLNGRMRTFEASYVVPAGGNAIGDRIVWGKLPVGARTQGWQGKLYFGAGAASSTLNLGDNVAPARHLAATSVASLGAAVPDAANVGGAQFETTTDTNTFANTFTDAADNCTLISTVAGAALLAGQVITLHFPYVQD